MSLWHVLRGMGGQPKVSAATEVVWARLVEVEAGERGGGRLEAGWRRRATHGHKGRDHPSRLHVQIDGKEMFRSSFLYRSPATPSAPTQRPNLERPAAVVVHEAAWPRLARVPRPLPRAALEEVDHTLARGLDPHPERGVLPEKGHPSGTSQRLAGHRVGQRAAEQVRAALHVRCKCEPRRRQRGRLGVVVL